MDRPLIALGLVLVSVPLVFSITRGLLEAMLIAPFLGALAYYVLLRDWEEDAGSLTVAPARAAAARGTRPRARTAASAGLEHGDGA
jgi:hypothetical protein